MEEEVNLAAEAVAAQKTGDDDEKEAVELKSLSSEAVMAGEATMAVLEDGWLLNPEPVKGNSILYI